MINLVHGHLHDFFLRDWFADDSLDNEWKVGVVTIIDLFGNINKCDKIVIGRILNLLYPLPFGLVLWIDALRHESELPVCLLNQLHWKMLNSIDWQFCDVRDELD